MQMTAQESSKPAVSAAEPRIDDMFKVGAHYGYSKARRHPSAKSFIFGAKNRVELFDLEKTAEALDRATAFVRGLGAEGKQLLFVGGKSEARAIVREAAKSIDMPYVAGRWIGGTLTNLSEIRKRVERLEDLVSKREKGELAKYTKRERLTIDREIEKLEESFRGIVSVKGMPAALFIVDPKKEHIAVTEARKMNVKTVALASSDCDMSAIDYVIPANDAAQASIKFFVDRIVEAYRGQA
jgi:small subunit ribosomal protein S2